MKFEVNLNGKNDLIDVNGEKRRSGFYVTRYVEANSPEQAETMAIDLVQGDLRLTDMLRNPDGDPPKIFLEEMYAIETFDDLETLTPGYGFYFEDES